MTFPKQTKGENALRMAMDPPKDGPVSVTGGLRARPRPALAWTSTDYERSATHAERMAEKFRKAGDLKHAADYMARARFLREKADRAHQKEAA